LGKMGNVVEEGRTVLFVSHNLNAVGRLCSRSLLLDNGQVMEDGPTARTLDSYTGCTVRAIAEYTQAENGSKRINLRRVVLMNAEGVITTEFEHREEITLQIEYEVNEPVRTCIVWAAIWTIGGTEVFVTADYDADYTLLRERSRGYYQAAVRIPGKSLNVGAYAIVVGITDYVYGAFNYDRVEAVGMHVVDAEDYPIDEGATRGGLLKPMLPWKTRKVES